MLLQYKEKEKIKGVIRIHLFNLPISTLDSNISWTAIKFICVAKSVSIVCACDVIICAHVGVTMRKVMPFQTRLKTQVYAPHGFDFQ